MSAPLPVPLWSNITVHILRHTAGDWWIDVWHETESGPKVARVPMASGRAGDYVTNEQTINVLEMVRSLLAWDIAQMVDPF
jgi:hypothetical protein